MLTVKVESLREERTQRKKERRENRVQGDKTLGCTSCLFILAYNDKYTYYYLTVPTSRLITLTAPSSWNIKD